MDTHVKIVGALNVAFSALGILFSLVLLAGLGGVAGIIGASAPPDEAAIAIPVIGLAGTFLAGVVLLLSLPGLIAGIGLLYLKPWARILAMVLAVIALLAVPWGTVFGIYALWVLLNKDTERLFAPTTLRGPEA